MRVKQPRFECTLCGACCRRPGVVVLRDDEVKRIAEYRGERVYDLVMFCDLEAKEDNEWWMELQDRTCVFLVDNRCSIQEVKPRQCSTYPFWPEFIDDDAAWELEREHCPGIGTGRVWKPLEVRAMLDLLQD